MKKFMIESWQELVQLLPTTKKANTSADATEGKDCIWVTHEALIRAGKWMENLKDLSFPGERVIPSTGNEAHVNKQTAINENQATNSSPTGTTDTLTPTGWFSSYYIGPTDDAILQAQPTPLHAADYIAQQHDLEYQALGLNGISGTLQPESKEADQRLIERCDELIADYEKGERTYHGFIINQTAYIAAKYMREYFIVEETVTDFFKKER